MTKICVACKHMTSVGTYVCRKSPDMVTGDAMPCSTVRADETKCGPEAKWHEPRDTDAPRPGTIETPMATIHARPPFLDDYKPE